MKFESKNSLLILTATEGMLIERKGLEFPNRSFARQVYLGKYDSVENYIDIDEAEANDICNVPTGRYRWKYCIMII